MAKQSFFKWLLTIITFLAHAPMLIGEEADVPSPSVEPSAKAEAKVGEARDLASKKKEVNNILDLQTDQKTIKKSLDNLDAYIIFPNRSYLSWFILELKEKDGEPLRFHFENPHGLPVSFGEEFAEGFVVGQNKCRLWSDQAEWKKESPLFKDQELSFVPLCSLYLRNSIEGRESRKEQVTDFIRRYTPFAESAINFAKQTVYKDHQLLESETHVQEKAEEQNLFSSGCEDQMKDSKLAMQMPELGLGLEKPTHDLAPCLWYHVKDSEGIDFLGMKMSLFPDELLESKKTAALDKVEKNALFYFVRFDLDKFGLGYEQGTKHPEVGWSNRAHPDIRKSNPRGPDGIDSVEPFVLTGLVPPQFQARTKATFTAGFKRDHAAFKWGPLSKKQDGSHYGVVQNGVVFSRLIPGLATLLIDPKGGVQMNSWQATEKDLFHARQNGVPILAEKGEIGDYVSNWSAGNWSGSAEGRQRALRAAVCLKDNYLVYGYFSTATPNAMALAFKILGCQYAMHLDMNALEHTYLALYHRHPEKGHVRVEHLHQGMEVLDYHVDNKRIPRFLGLPDNRDFFYLYRKSK